MKNRLKTHVLFTGMPDVIEICRPLQSIGIEGFIYMCHYPDGSFLDLSNQPAWSEHFLSNFLAEEYSLADLKKHMLLNEGINLWTLNMDNLIWQEGMQNFNAGNGVTFCKTYKNLKEIVCFYTHKNNTAMNGFYLNHTNELMAFIGYFKEKAKSLIREGEENRLYIPKIYLSNSETKLRNRLYTQSQDPTHKFLNKIGRPSIPTNTSPQNHLTPRELACIQACAEGKSAKEIGEILYLSHRTVEEHLTNAKRKLGCQNISQLIFKASRLYSFDLI